MSDKRPYEDKASVAAPVPRELSTLIEITGELRQAVEHKARERMLALMDQLATAWSRGNSLQLKISATSDYPDRTAVLVALADALNAAMAAKGDALGLLTTLGTPR